MALSDTGPLRPADDEATPSARIVRPYTLTAGRTRSRVDLPMEAIVHREEVGPGRRPEGVVGRILEVCDHSSVAEVSAQVGMPVGVVRVLLGDLVEQGYVRVQETLTERSSMDERRELIERTLRGLRAF
jgi:hypothetical protein